ncbi:MAG: restriction endonuclease subunit S [Lewinellaceae bacterium]|nr:restriction endonuclease subunit S [Lewinellaceae bacterium]
MQNWVTVKIGEIIKVTSGGTPSRKKPEYYNNGNIPWVKTGDLKEKELFSASEFISEKGLKNSSAKLFPPDTVLIALYGATIGACSILRIEAATNQACAALLPSKKIDPKYLFYFLVHHKPKLIAAGVGGAQSNISGQIIKSTTIPLPPLPTQRRIAAILDKADALRRKDRELLGQYDELVQAVFLEMFGNLFQDSHGVVKKKKLYEVSDTVSGVTKGRKLNGKKLFEVPYMRVANVQDGYIDLSEIKTIEVPMSDIEKYRLQKGDVLLTEGGDPDKLGRGSVWKYEIKDCIHQNHIYRVRVDRDVLNPEYLSALIGSKYGKIYFLRAAKQTTGIATINSTQLKNFPVLIPDISLQNKFAKAVKNIEAQRKRLENQTAKGEELFQSLLQRAFRGELTH